MPERVDREHGGPRRTPASRRTTPKKGAAPEKREVATPSSRYTPPVPKSVKVSPPWVPALMFTLLLLGALVVVLNYLGVLPGGADNLYLLLGLGLITGGFIAATQYH